MPSSEIRLICAPNDDKVLSSRARAIDPILPGKGDRLGNSLLYFRLLVSLQSPENLEKGLIKGFNLAGGASG